MLYLGTYDNMPSCVLAVNLNKIKYISHRSQHLFVTFCKEVQLGDIKGDLKLLLITSSCKKYKNHGGGGLALLPNINP